MTRYLSMLIPGGQEAIDRALADCTKQNGGKLVGNPTAPPLLLAKPFEGRTVSALIIQEDADPAGWWSEYRRVHGYRDPEYTPEEPGGAWT